MKIVIMLIILIGIILSILAPSLISYFKTKEYEITFDNQKRSYRLHLPNLKQSDKKVPLIIALHGRGMSTKLMEIYSGLSHESDKKKFIIVYPSGTADSNGQNRSWNSGFCCFPALQQHVDDIGFLSKLIDDISKKYPIDKEKIFMVGFSNGGMMAYDFAMHSNVAIKSIAVDSGTINGTVFEDKPYLKLPTSVKPISIIMLHGMKDLTVPYNGGRGNSDYSDFLGFQQSVDYWVKNNNIKTNPIIEENSDYIRKIYSEKNKETIEAISIKNGKHEWFGAIQNILPILSKGISSNDEIMKFFNLI